jgi:hypothetical protein
MGCTRDYWLPWYFKYSLPTAFSYKETLINPSRGTIFGQERTLSTFDEPNQFKPAYHYAIETEMSWLHDDLPRMRLDEDANFAEALESAGTRDS